MAGKGVKIGQADVVLSNTSPGLTAKNLLLGRKQRGLSGKNDGQRTATGDVEPRTKEGKSNDLVFLGGKK